MDNIGTKAKNLFLMKTAVLVLCIWLNPHSKLMGCPLITCPNQPIAREITNLSCRATEQRNYCDEAACTAFAMTTSDRGPILGDTLDRGNPARSFACMERLEYEGSFKLIHCGGVGINEMGLAIGTANTHYLGKTGEGDGQSRDVSILVLRYCSNVQEAVDFIKDYEIVDDGRHFVVADIHGKAAAIEKGPQQLFNVRWTDAHGGARAVWVANTSPDPEMRRNLNGRTMRYPENSDNRYAYLKKAFARADFEYTFESAENLLFAHDPCGPICQHGESIPQLYTTKTRLLLPAEGRLLLAARINPGDSEWRTCKLGWVAEEVIELKVPSGQQEKKEIVTVPELKGFTLRPNKPNPFNGSTTICYGLAEASDVELSIFIYKTNKLITLKKEFQSAGAHCVVWDGTDESGQRLSPGRYYYQLKVGGQAYTRGMTLLE